MRLAVYNVENLFDRPKAMNHGTWAEGKPVLEKFAALNALLGEAIYTDAARAKMVKLMIELGLEKSDTGDFVLLRRNRGGLLKRPKSGGIEIMAGGRANWVGSLELIDEPVNEQSMRNTARVINDLKADVLGVVEAESRPVLAGFNEDILPVIGGDPFAHVMLIDGNDGRGIDVGLMSRKGFPIGLMRSHVDDRSGGGQKVFSRDCPEFEVTTKKGNRLLILVNHFKSKGYGSKASSDARRKAQAARVAEIVKERLAQGTEYIAVIGDLNDTPESDPLKPLLKGTKLTDVFKHPEFDYGGFPGTFGSCGEKQKFDYLLLSAKLLEKMSSGGVIRKGMWPGVRPRKWEVYGEIASEDDVASDHAAIFADLDI